MADRRAGPRQGPYVPSPGGGKQPRARNEDGQSAVQSRAPLLSEVRALRKEPGGGLTVARNAGFTLPLCPRARLL